MPRRTQDPARVFGNFAYRACTFCGRAFNPVRLSPPFPRRGPTTPAQSRFGLLRFRSPLLSESLLFSFPPGTKMFQLPGFLLTNSYVGSDWTSLQPGSPIRIPPDRCLFTTPRGVSPFTASFFCSICQDIHRTLFFIYSRF